MSPIRAADPIDDLRAYLAASKRKARQLDRRIAAIEHERAKWAEKAMRELVPDDIARTNQCELTIKLAAGESDRAKLLTSDAGYSEAIRVATELLRLCGEAYARGNDALRRDWNQTWFDAIEIDDHQDGPTVDAVQRTPFFEAARTAEVLDHPLASWDWSGDAGNEEPDGRGHRVLSHVAGSNVPLWWS